jgi:hypothetical protein
MKLSENNLRTTAIAEWHTESGAVEALWLTNLMQDAGFQMVEEGTRPGTLYFWPTNHDGCPRRSM